MDEVETPCGKLVQSIYHRKEEGGWKRIRIKLLKFLKFHSLKQLLFLVKYIKHMQRIPNQKKFLQRFLKTQKPREAAKSGECVGTRGGKVKKNVCVRVSQSGNRTPAIRGPDQTMSFAL